MRPEVCPPSPPPGCEYGATESYRPVTCAPPFCYNPYSQSYKPYSHRASKPSAHAGTFHEAVQAQPPSEMVEPTALAIAKIGTGIALAAPLAATAGVVSLLTRMHGSVGTAAPTVAMFAEEDRTKSALFRHLPMLSDKLAWRSLGAPATTPIHRCTMTEPEGDEDVQFFVKREDLASPAYGGNKVRTLQHQLAVIESRQAAGDPRYANVNVLGSGGSNQVLATAVHARLRLPSVTPVWFDKDTPDLDNALNMLSTLSLPTAPTFNWGEPLPMLRRLLRAAIGGDGVIVTLGGNCPAGVLGQVGGFLELVEHTHACVHICMRMA